MTSWLEAGMANRRVSAHALNRESSRTHALSLGGTVWKEKDDRKTMENRVQ